MVPSELKKLLDWQSKEIVQLYDELTLWSAPFGRMLLENMPLKKGANIVDLGFGTGFPLIELSQRFGKHSKIYGIDIWKEGVALTKQKIEAFDLDNITIIEKSAVEIKLDDNSIDTITSNLGVNNFEDREKVYKEINRILKMNGRLCITTNPIGTFVELFDLFESVMKELSLSASLEKLETYLAHRSTKETIVQEIEAAGLTFVQSKEDATNFRFIDGTALLNHYLIRIGFRESWDSIIDKSTLEDFYNLLIKKINAIVQSDGEFKITVPMLYLEFEKKV